MFKTAVRWMVRRNIARLNEGDYGPALAMFGPRSELAFPGSSSWSDMFRPIAKGRDAHVTHIGRDEVEAFMKRYVDTKIHMEVDDVLVNGWPWNTRIAVRVHHWVEGPDGTDIYNNRAILFIDSKWGRVVRQEDYEDTERVAEFDALSTVIGEPSLAPADDGVDVGVEVGVT